MKNYELLPSSAYSSDITSRRVTDCRTALTRALAQYIEDYCKISPTNGRDDIKLKKVLDTYAEPETLAEYPSACVYAEGTGQYGRSGGSLGPIETPEDSIGTTSYVYMGDYQIQLKVEVWCDSPQERMMFSMALENILHPYEWLAGMRLKLPHYHNVVGIYGLASSMYEDEAADDLRRYRKLALTVDAQCPFIRAFTLAELQPRAQVDME